MESSKSFAVAVAVTFAAVCAQAAHIDMSDPKRALGREDDVRVDAQLLRDTVSSGTPVGITYQVENLTQQPIGVADKVCELSYDDESRTITVAVGSEVPARGEMPHVTTIMPGAKKTFTSGAMLRIAAPATRSPFVSTPQFVEVHVSILRDVAPFRALISDQSSPAAPPIQLTDQQFDAWLQSNDTIFLNAIPVHYNAAPKGNLGDASQAANPQTTF
jgi:hypothetical protein